MLFSVVEVIRSWQCFDSGMGERCSSQILRIGLFREEEEGFVAAWLRRMNAGCSLATRVAGACLSGFIGAGNCELPGE